MSVNCTLNHVNAIFQIPEQTLVRGIHKCIHQLPYIQSNSLNKMLSFILPSPAFHALDIESIMFFNPKSQHQFLSRSQSQLCFRHSPQCWVAFCRVCLRSCPSWGCPRPSGRVSTPCPSPSGRASTPCPSPSGPASTPCPSPCQPSGAAGPLKHTTPALTTAQQGASFRH